MSFGEILAIIIIAVIIHMIIADVEDKGGIND